MIVKQYLDVIEGRKTQTRRMKDRYQVGRVYSVVPKMYQGTVQYAWTSVSEFAIWHPTDPLPSVQEWLKLKVRITDKRIEPLQNLSETDAIAEGIRQDVSGAYYVDIHGYYCAARTARGAYIGLWDFINTKKGLRWADNPTVVVYCFEVVKPAD